MNNSTIICGRKIPKEDLTMFEEMDIIISNNSTRLTPPAIQAGTKIQPFQTSVRAGLWIESISQTNKATASVFNTSIVGSVCLIKSTGTISCSFIGPYDIRGEEYKYSSEKYTAFYLNGSVLNVTDTFIYNRSLVIAIENSLFTLWNSPMTIFNGSFFVADQNNTIISGNSSTTRPTVSTDCIYTAASNNIMHWLKFGLLTDGTCWISSGGTMKLNISGRAGGPELLTFKYRNSYEIIPFNDEKSIEVLLLHVKIANETTFSYAPFIISIPNGTSFLTLRINDIQKDIVLDWNEIEKRTVSNSKDEKNASLFTTPDYANESVPPSGNYNIYDFYSTRSEMGQSPEEIVYDFCVRKGQNVSFAVIVPLSSRSNTGGTYFWDFGDGNYTIIYQTTVLFHTYTYKGTKRTYLNYSTGEGNFTIFSLFGNVTNSEPVPDFSIINPRQFRQGDVILLRAVEGCDPDDEDKLFLNFTWRIISPDGTTLTKNGTEVEFKAEQAGEYSITLIAVDPDGGYGYYSRPIAVLEKKSIFSNPWVLTGIIAGAVLLGALLLVVIFIIWRGQFRADKAFIIYRDGRLIAQDSSIAEGGQDADIMTSMLTAVQEFVNDTLNKNLQHEEGAAGENSTKTGGEKGKGLNEIKHEQKRIIIEHHNNLCMAIMGEGNIPVMLRYRMKALLKKVEKEHRDILKDWNGSLEEFEGLKSQLDNLISKYKHKKKN